MILNLLVTIIPPDQVSAMINASIARLFRLLAAKRPPATQGISHISLFLLTFSKELSETSDSAAQAG
jgi:hypothetical protein